VKGDLASGEKVVCAGSTTARLLDQHYDNAFATEMEGRGFCEAVKQFIDIERLVPRGISDLLYGPPEGQKSPAANRVRQPMAAAHAAAFAFELLASIENPTHLVQQEPRIARSTTTFARYNDGGAVEESQFLHDLSARFNGGSTQDIRIGPMFLGLASGPEDIDEICIQGAEDRIARIAARMKEQPQDRRELVDTWRIRAIAASDGLMPSQLYPIPAPGSVAARGSGLGARRMPTWRDLLRYRVRSIRGADSGTLLNWPPTHSCGCRHGCNRVHRST
jgi:hypothetical protein